MLTILLLLAQPAEWPPKLPECDQEQADFGNQAAMNQCAHREYLIADAQLTEQWTITSELMKQADADDWRSDDPQTPEPAYFEHLLTAQRAWLAYREAHCESEAYAYTGGGGSIMPLLISHCKTTLTKERTKQLREIAESPR